MADDKSTRRRLLEKVEDQEAAASTAVFMDAPGIPKLEGKNAAMPGTGKSSDPLLKRETAASSSGGGSNLRRSHLTRRHFVISIITSLVIGLLVHLADRRFFERELAAKLGAQGGVPAAAAGPTSADITQTEQITALQKQLDVVRREQLITQQSTRESLERISDVLKNPALAPAPVAPVSATTGEARIADAKVDVSPTQAEFIQLKERNRLTQYADEAIATGMRKPLEAIVEYLRDPASKHLHDAAQSEYLRAVRAIQILQREDPSYRLPVADLFKGSKVREEADLTPEALHKLLEDAQQPAEVRARACFLLLGSNAADTNAKLIQAIKSDPSLEVAKQAQIALEQRVKRRFRMFDIPAIEDWWKSQGGQ
ncbi:MAG: hypothetical protein ACO1TE_12435 [Prosthecobacter sp.]